MRHADGTRCAGLGATICTGDAGVVVRIAPRGSNTAYFFVRVRSAPTRYTATFSDGCTGAPNGVSSTPIKIDAGELLSCHVSFRPPGPHGQP